MSVSFADVSAVVVDIEGTTSKTSHVFDVLFPYARTRIASWITSAPASVVTHLSESAADILGVDSLSSTELIAALEDWSDRDVKASPLKSVQGEIWSAGFASGELTSHLFEDVVPQLRTWSAAGIALYVFSSGSVTAQKSWFSHTADGDLSSLFSGYFDTVTAGNKRETNSYHAISSAISVAPSSIVFLTDVVAEAAAASDAGWKVVLLARDGEPQSEAARSQTDFDVVDSFANVMINKN